jgi:hypothetical protein
LVLIFHSLIMFSLYLPSWTIPTSGKCMEIFVIKILFPPTIVL